jgi:ubiquinone/menaquinone biosynthesis C-methylase UbiE
MKLFRSGLPPHHTALAMIGAKPASTVLVIGAADPSLAAEVALITGLNGRTVTAADAHAGAAVQAAADRAGALVDFEPVTGDQLPFDPDAFDIVVIQQQLGARPEAQAAITAEAARVVRSGGRIVAIEGEQRSGGLAMWRRATPHLGGDAMVSLLNAAGLIAVRVLGESEGMVYAEGRKR